MSEEKSMTKKELIEALKAFHDDMKISLYISAQIYTNQDKSVPFYIEAQHPLISISKDDLNETIWLQGLVPNYTYPGLQLPALTPEEVRKWVDKIVPVSKGGIEDE